MPQGISHHYSQSPHAHARAAKKPKTKAKPPAVYQPGSGSGPGSAFPAFAADPDLMSRDLAKPHIRSASVSASMNGARTTSSTPKKRPREEDRGRESASRRTRSAGGDRDRGEGREKEAAFQRQLIGVFVPRALKESAEGKTANYSDLVAHFLPKPLEPGGIALPPLLPLLRALTAHVSLLRPELHGALVTAILALPWATADDRFVKTYVGWAGVLVSAHPVWAKEVVAMAVKGFRWRKFGAEYLPDVPEPIFSESNITRRVYHARHHFLLAHLLSLIPTLPTVLQQLLQKNAPHKRDTEVAQSTWVRNCCEMIEYCPELGARVWSGLVDKMLRIDVEITNSVEDDDDDEDDGDEEDEEEDMIRPAAPEIDPFDLLVSQDMPRSGDETDDDDDSDDDDADPDIDALSTDEEEESEDELIDDKKAAELRRQKRDNLKALRCKLDAMLTHFLRHLEGCMGNGVRGMSAVELGAQFNSASLGSGSSSATSTPRGSRPATPTTAAPGAVFRPPPTAAQSLAHFQTLLNLFSRQILPTSATQHLPFVLFLCASFTPAHTELLLHLLVLQSLYARTTDAPTLASQPVSLPQRVAATVYIGSLVCRARFVSDDQARTVTQYLLAYVEGKLVQAREKPLNTLDELPLFYAVCQAIMLIFCFRFRALRTSNPAEECVTGEMDMDDLEESSSGEWMRDLDTLQRALTSDLNPLLGCNTTVVNTFAKVAHSTGFAYCFSIIEANQQNQQAAARPALANGGRRVSGAGSRRGTALAMQAPRHARQVNVDAGLDGYFPFDPYDLPRSGEFIEALYRTWDDVGVDLGGDSDDSDEDEEEDEDDEGEMEEMVSSDEDLAAGRRPVPRVNRAIPKPSPGNSYGNRRRDLLRDGVLSTSLETMSISPNISA